MEFDLFIRRVLINAETGEVIEQEDKPVGTATLEEIHDFHATGNDKIWRRGMQEAHKEA
jgi:hypothetical protein